jgi:hypothetical protein
MNRLFYTDYVRHCLRFYARNVNKPRFNTEVDENNWYACHKAIEPYSDRDKDIFLRVYGLRDTLEDNVYETSKIYLIDQNIIWKLMRELERNIAKKRGLL